MHANGSLSMLAAVWGVPIGYSLKVGGVSLPISEWLGRRLTLRFAGEIHCTRCGCSMRKSFGDGTCYACFRSAPECSPCVIRPELCRAHLGAGGNGSCIDRDPEWAREHHAAPQVAYLAVSSGLKIGVTRPERIPLRWINQGASRAVCFALVSNRFAVGEIEVAAKAHVSDRTDWRKMLCNVVPDVDLVAEKRRLSALIGLNESWVHADDRVTEITYPVLEYPQKVKSVTLDKAGGVDGVLVGIKGQYLILEGGVVFNVRRHQGYVVGLTVEGA